MSENQSTLSDGTLEREDRKMYERKKALKTEN